MGEGAHFYKIDGKYYITSAWYAGRMRMPAARADRIEGPWEINQAISADEDVRLRQGTRLRDNGNSPEIVVNARQPDGARRAWRCIRAASCRRRPASGGACRCSTATPSGVSRRSRR